MRRVNSYRGVCDGTAWPRSRMGKMFHPTCIGIFFIWFLMITTVCVSLCWAGIHVIRKMHQHGLKGIVERLWEGPKGMNTIDSP